MSVEGPGAPRWAALRRERLRAWFAASPFCAGSPLARPHDLAFHAESGLYDLRDEAGRLCCRMSAAEIAKAVAQ